MTRPGLMTATQCSGAPLPEPMRVSAGFYVRALAHDGRGLFRGIPNPFPATRYHSLAALSVPDCFEVTARTADRGELMAVRHRERPLLGVQFHPESYLTPSGGAILRNFLESPAA